METPQVAAEAAVVVQAFVVSVTAVVVAILQAQHPVKAVMEETTFQLLHMDPVVVVEPVQWVLPALLQPVEKVVTALLVQSQVLV